MTQYLITKREKCERCGGTGELVYRSNDEDVMDVIVACADCRGGYINTPVDLLEVLAKVRFDLLSTDHGHFNGKYMDNLTIED